MVAYKMVLLEKLY